MKYCGKIWYSRAGHRQYGTFAVHTAYLKLKTHTHSMQYLLLFTVTMVARTHINIALYLTLPVFSHIKPTFDTTWHSGVLQIYKIKHLSMSLNLLAVLFQTKICGFG
jgi:hypothetical protein